ncbi:MAG: class I SAM-dependent methyltransferase [Syntrophomonadaceae bacterium]|nr:class I SAM-dependent methyltransferase [Syntrophomonadaceae bacterium]
MHLIVTTTQSQDSVSVPMAEFLSESRFPYVPRRGLSLAKLAAQNGADAVIVWEEQGPVLRAGEEKLFFHPSMAKSRIAAHRKQGRVDNMVKACQLQPGDSFLDCTLGMGADAIVASYFSGTGAITGLESQPALAAVIGWGMKLYRGKMPWLNQAVQRVQVIAVHHRDYLQMQPDRSQDIIYFDPMFSQPLLQSQPISALRRYANHDALDPCSIDEACRVARKRVVLKSEAGLCEFERLGFRRVEGSKHNPIAYGVIIAT